MKSSKIIQFLIILLCSGHIAVSNTKPFPGYFITLKGDTIICQISFNDWTKSPNSIEVLVGKEKQVLQPSDIKGFGVSGYYDYISAKVSYHLNPIGGADLPTEYSDSMAIKNCFLKTLISGYYSLYELSLPERTYFFYNYKEGGLTELLYRVRFKENKIEPDFHYRNTMFELFAKDSIADKNFYRINNAGYISPDLKALISILNQFHNGGHKIKKENSLIWEADLFAGINMGIFPSSFDAVDAKGNKLPNSLSPSAGASLLLTIPGNFKSFKVGVSLGYTGYNARLVRSGYTVNYSSAYYYDTVTYTETLTTKNQMMLVHVFISYILNPLKKTKFYAKAGLSYDFSLNSNVNVNSNDTSVTVGVRNGDIPIYIAQRTERGILTIKRSLPDLLLGFGMVSGRHKLEIEYFPAKQASLASFDSYNGGNGNGTTFKIGRLALYYFFSILNTRKDTPKK